MNKSFSSSYSLSDQEAQQLFRRHFSYTQLPVHLEDKLISQVLLAVKKEYPFKSALDWGMDVLFKHLR